MIPTPPEIGTRSTIGLHFWLLLPRFKWWEFTKLTNWIKVKSNIFLNFFMDCCLSTISFLLSWSCWLPQIGDWKFGSDWCQLSILPSFLTSSFSDYPCYDDDPMKLKFVLICTSLKLRHWAIGDEKYPKDGVPPLHISSYWRRCFFIWYFLIDYLLSAPPLL